MSCRPTADSAILASHHYPTAAAAAAAPIKCRATQQ